MSEDDLGGGFSTGGKPIQSIPPVALEAMAESQSQPSQTRKEGSLVGALGLLGLTIGILYAVHDPKETYIESACPHSLEQPALPANNMPYLDVTLSDDQTLKAHYRGQGGNDVLFSQTIGGQYQPTIDYMIEVSGDEATGTITRRSLEHETYRSSTQLYRQDNGCWEERK